METPSCQSRSKTDEKEKYKSWEEGWSQILSTHVSAQCLSTHLKSHCWGSKARTSMRFTVQPVYPIGQPCVESQSYKTESACGRHPSPLLACTCTLTLIHIHSHKIQTPTYSVHTSPHSHKITINKSWKSEGRSKLSPSTPSLLPKCKYNVSSGHTFLLP